MGKDLDLDILRGMVKKLTDETNRVQIQVLNNLDERLRSATPAENAEIDKYVKRPLMLHVTSVRRNVVLPLEALIKKVAEARQQ